jgi:transposase
VVCTKSTARFCGLDANGKVKIQERVATSEAGLRKVFEKRKSCRVALESGGQSSWAARVLGEMGHEVVTKGLGRHLPLDLEERRPAD